MQGGRNRLARQGNALHSDPRMDEAVSHNKAAVLLWHVTALLRPLLYFVILLLLTLTLRIGGWKKKRSTHSNALQHPPDGVLDLITTLTLRRRTIRADRPPMIAHIARTSPPGTAQLTSYRVSTVSVRLTSELAIYLVYHAGGRTINIHTNASQHPPYGILS